MNNRLLVILLVVYLVMGVFVSRLWQLQVVQHQSYALKSQGNTLRYEAILPPRGRLFDRNGKLIATNRLAIDLVYYGGPIQFSARILGLLGLKELPSIAPGNKEAVLKTNIQEALVPTLAELTAGQDNLRLIERLERTYPRPISGAVLGYVNLPNQEQVARGYDPSEMVGVQGLEAGLESLLRGKKGVRLVEVDVRGERIREEVIREPQPGQDVYLAIDLEVQKAAETAITEAIDDINRGRSRLKLPRENVARGAIVALDPRTGEVLAMASGPSFDPNAFVRRPRDPKLTQPVLLDPSNPMLNRAVQAYAPGSTFKLSTSSMLLENNLATAGTTYPCSSLIIYGGFPRRNWARYNMGPMNAKDAIAQSCNTWYYQAVIAAGPLDVVDQLARRSDELGLGRHTGLEILERTGFLPTRSWKREVQDEPWYPGETLSYAIGQGQTLATPSQIARMLATIATNGRQPELHLVRQIGSQVVKPQITQIKGQYWKVLQDGMRQTVVSGTARGSLASFPVATAGKTGTAETNKQIGYEHAWYMGYGPVGNNDNRPPLVVVAFFERAGEGSQVALPAARKVMAAHWKVSIPQPQPKPTPTPPPGLVN